MKITHTRPAQQRSVLGSIATRERFLQKPFRPVFFRRETDRPFSNKEVTTLPWAVNNFLVPRGPEGGQISRTALALKGVKGEQRGKDSRRMTRNPIRGDT